uniref:Uncharacterized protein n=1 Tax=Strigamia maritima TaxID=126957 RepID=T1IXP2_STRMM
MSSFILSPPHTPPLQDDVTSDTHFGRSDLDAVETLLSFSRQTVRKRTHSAVEDEHDGLLEQLNKRNARDSELAR